MNSVDPAQAKLLQQSISVPVPRVSVILPSYNHATFVGQAIESVLSQSFNDLELIIIDDGSSDGSVAKIRSITDPRIQLEALPTNCGYSSALNASIARARGELIALHCSDDVFLPGKLERQVAFLDANPGVAAVFGQPVFVDKNGRHCPSRTNPFNDNFISDLPDRFAWLRRFFLHGNALCHPTALVRRTVFDKVGGYDPLLMQLQDYDFWIRVCGKHEIRVLDESLVAYRVLGAGQNTSWPTPEAIRRDAWETRRVLRRFLAFDTALIRRAFGPDLDALGLVPDLPPGPALGLLLAAHGKGAARQALALELLEAAVAEGGNAGFTRATFCRLTGELDPFNLNLAEATQQAAARTQWVGELEQRAAAAEALARAVTSSTMWRATAPLRRLVDRHTALRAAVRRAIGAVAGSTTSSAISGGKPGKDCPRPRGELAIEATKPSAPLPLPPNATLAPSTLPSAAQALPEWEYVPEGWRPNDPRGAGWEHASITEAQQRKWPTFVKAIQSTNPLGVYHEAAQIDCENPAAHNFVLASMLFTL